VAGAAGDLRGAVNSMLNLAVSQGSVSPSRALASADEGIAYAAAHGVPTEPVRRIRLEALVAAGRWDEAVSEAEGLHSWAEEHGDGGLRLYVERVQAIIRLERGESSSAFELLGAEAGDVGLDAAHFAPTVAEVARDGGRPEIARLVIADALDATPETIATAGLVRASLRAGSPGLARRALAIKRQPCPTGDAEAEAAEAMLAEAEGDVEGARDGFVRATRLFARLEMIPEEAYALAGLGRCLLALGETKEGIARLWESRAIWERLRATPRIAEIDALLATVA
jgi:hypothetical protein